jgi:hypothetical protein
MKHDYTTLDAEILKRIRESSAPVGFSALFNWGPIKLEAERLSAAQQLQTKGREIKQPFRFVDARLQALRKAGKIEPHRSPSGWAMAKGVTS